MTVPSLKKESRGARNSSLAQSYSENNFRLEERQIDAHLRWDASFSIPLYFWESAFKVLVAFKHIHCYSLYQKIISVAADIGGKNIT